MLHQRRRRQKHIFLLFKKFLPVFAFWKWALSFFIASFILYQIDTGTFWFIIMSKTLKMKMSVHKILRTRLKSGIVAAVVFTVVFDYFIFAIAFFGVLHTYCPYFISHPLLVQSFSGHWKWLDIIKQKITTKINFHGAIRISNRVQITWNRNALNTYKKIKAKQIRLKYIT